MIRLDSMGDRLLYFSYGHTAVFQSFYLAVYKSTAPLVFLRRCVKVASAVNVNASVAHGRHDTHLLTQGES